MKNLNFELDSVHGGLSLVTNKLERLMTSIQWLDRDLFEEDRANLEDAESFVMAYNERKIQSELHCEVLGMYVKELQELTEEVRKLNAKAWKEYRENKKADTSQDTLARDEVPATRIERL